MKGKNSFRVLVAALVLVLSSSMFLAARLDVFTGYGPLDKESYLPQAQLLFIRPGLDLEILGVTIPADRKAVVTFSLKDPAGLPLDRDGVFTPGPVSTSFIFGRIPAGATQYLSYTARTVTSPINGNSAIQAGTDSGGSYAKIADGEYTYTLGTALPEGFDPNVTHTMGVYARRDLREFDLDRYVDNETFSFVPSGAEVTTVRDVVRTENCNQCHNPLALHGGSRVKTELCILCHQPQSSDPDTGNTVDFKVMIHKIHRGENLPSVEAGTPYQIIGFGGSVHDFSEIAFPQDIRNCETCHKDATQGDAYMLNPTRAACGSCHDDVDFATGANHPGGIQSSDAICAACHRPEGEFEFDASIKGAHTIPDQSKQLKGLNVELLEVVNTAPGENPTVRFKLTEDDGTIIPVTTLNRISFNLAGPTTDYATVVRESSVQGAVVPLGADEYTYTFAATIPPGATGSYAIGSEARRDVVLNEGMTSEMAIREQELENPVIYFSVSGAPVVPRRAVVADAKCESCHNNLAMHGGNRHDPEYCVTCHQPGAADRGSPPQSIHFKFMIHRIHTGHELSRDFEVGGHEYNELHFPGDRRDCETCHVNDSYTLPLPQGLLATTAPREFYSPIPPVAAACVGCHDTEVVAAHAQTMTITTGFRLFGNTRNLEVCVVCHGTGADFSVERVHAR